jgi:hypothetical protein
MGSSVEPGDAFRSVRIHIPQLLALKAVACISIDAEEAPAATAAKSAFVFGGVGYLHRWSMNDQHEFTPEGQEDLDKWSDMITVNVYPSAHDGDALAAKAKAVLENYKSHNARVLRTNSVPRRPDRPAEHFIAVVFGRPKFIEVAFARFKLVDGVGCSIVYSHRIYGEKVGDQMGAWLNDNGPKVERRLMEWNDFPSPASLRGLPHKESRPSTTKVSSSESCGRHRFAMEEPESAIPAPDFSQPSRPLLQFCGSTERPHSGSISFVVISRLLCRKALT